MLGWVEAFIGRLWYDERAATTMEYALLLALVALAVIVALTGLGKTLQAKLEEITDRLRGAVVDPGDLTP